MYDSLPRPYDSLKPGDEMWKIMQKDWLISIANEIHQLTYSNLLQRAPIDPSTMKILHIFRRSMIILVRIVGGQSGQSFGHLVELKLRVDAV